MTARLGFTGVDDAFSVLDGLRSGAQKMIHGEYAKVLDDDFFELGRRLDAHSREIWAAQVAWVDEAHQRGMAGARSYSSTRVLVREVLRISAREAGLRVRAAEALHAQDLPSGGEAPAQLPVLAAAVTAGLVVPDHVNTVLATMRRLPNSLDQDTRLDAEQALVTHAVDLNPDQFRAVAHHLEEALNPDGTLDDRDPSSRVEFSIGTRSASTGLTSINGKLDDLSVEMLRVAIDGLAAPRPAVDGIRDPRPATTRRAHALVEVIRRAITHTDLPGHGGQRPQVTVTMNWNVITKRLGSAVTDSGATLDPAVARQVLCDAEITPAILGTESEVLDLGRTTRTFGRATRRAITVRDKGCCFPGCDRPSSWTDVHHLKFWDRDLGATSYQNGCLLCPYHHSEIHKGRWTGRMGDDGIPEFIPPKWIDPEQKPRRNTVHHLVPDFGIP